MRIFTTIALVVVCFAAAAGATILTPPAAAAPPSDPCSLLTAGQISSVVGAQLGPGKSNGFATCTWVTTGVIVTLWLEKQDMFNAGKNAHAPSVITAVGGLGDDAYYLKLADQIALHVKKGDTTFKVTIYSSSRSVDQKQQIEKVLAQQALSKL